MSEILFQDNWVLDLKHQKISEYPYTFVLLVKADFPEDSLVQEVDFKLKVFCNSTFKIKEDASGRTDL